MVPVGMKYTAQVSGTVVKLVRCESCAGEYVYQMTRTAQGQGSSFLFLDNRGASQRAEDSAHQQMERNLKAECDPVPCPHCGWYQAAMVREARRRFRSWLFNGGALLAAGGFLLSFIALGRELILQESWGKSVWVAGLVLGAAGLGLLLARQILCGRYDPNRVDAEVRRRRGQELVEDTVDLGPPLLITGFLRDLLGQELVEDTVDLGPFADMDAYNASIAQVQVRVEDTVDGAAVVTVVPPDNVAELDRQCLACFDCIPTWEEKSAAPLLDALLALASSGGGGVVVDLTAMRRGSAAVVAIINDAWLALSERGRSLAVVATDDLEAALSIRGLQAECRFARTRAHAILLATTAPAVQPVDVETAASLDAIEQRLRALICERIGHLYGGGEPSCPPVARLVRAGVRRGGAAFPNGGLSWRVTDAGSSLQLEYDDYARVASGWGCRYVISAGDTVLVEEGLD